MTSLRLILRNLLYFRGVNLAVIAGVMVATAVLSGALMVGDSVRASLTDLAVRRLGRIDHALLAHRFVPQTLVERMTGEAEIQRRFEIGPAVIVRGGASVDSGEARSAGIQILGVRGEWAPVKSGEVILNDEAARSLGIVSPGAEIVLSVPTESDVPLDATLAQRSRQDVLSGMRVKVAQIVREPGMLSLFNPGGGQRAPKNAWVNLTDLQDAVGRRGQINTLLVHDKLPSGDGATLLNGAIRRAMTLNDYGLDLAPVAGTSDAALTSRNTYLGVGIELTAEPVLDEANIPGQVISVNLLNAVHRLAEDGSSAASIHYAVAAGVTARDDLSIADDEVALNQWAADRLGAKVGDRIGFSFYRRQADGSLTEVSDADRGFPNRFRVSKILPMTGIGADRSLTPTYKGMTDADTIASWDPPEEVKIDRSRVTDADEAYWKEYRAAPKMFFSFATSSRLWGDAFGNATSVRVPADRAEEIGRKLLESIDPAAMGLLVRPLRQEQLAAASGTTDFGQLFIGFSFFLIIAAALLVAMLLRLGVEQRGRQLGAMSALGFAPASLRKLMLVEGMLLAIVGGILGSFAAIGYTWLMMAGLRTWWVGAVGTTAMRLHVEPVTLIIGFVIAMMVALVAILWAVWQVGKASPARLLAGGWEAARPVKPGRGGMAQMFGLAGIAGGVAVILLGIFGIIPQQVAFLAGGAILLTSSLCLASAMLRPRRGRAVAASIEQLGIRNATRHTARSVLCIGLIALASFALVTVSAMRQGEPTDTGDVRSGSGGYRLIIESDIPLLRDPSTEEGRAVLGFREPANPIWSRVEFLPIRRQPGQDVSCLNLTKATSPTILGIPQSMIDRGGFVSGTTSPWTKLNELLPDGQIPILADSSTATYILHIKVGDTLDVIDASGVRRRLQLVGTLPHTIFQSQLLMSDVHFRDMFPTQSGFGIVLVKVNPEDQQAVQRMLNDDLNEFAATISTTSSVLASYLEVQNTYLSTFELLGALGLMLGTVGLAVVLVRTVIERESELALLASIGFRSDARIRLVLSENVFLLVAGLLLGTICALVGVLPALMDASRGINIASLAITLMGALLFGLCASGVAVAMIGHRVTPADLRRE